ncbi:MAG: OmpA family protein [Planctomycetes bacterium]|nr:OmpA family protein [Planctomycetota bacterium]
MGEFVEEPKKGPPAYMVSFADMMTLILTFFILLVSMSKEQNYGLMAKGVGSFIVALQSHGLSGVMSGTDQSSVFEEVRRKFNLPPEPDASRRTNHDNASRYELMRAEDLQSLTPHDEVPFPSVARFEPGSAVLTEASRSYIDGMAGSLEPHRSQLLWIEGHADDAASGAENDNVVLAILRARAVREYLIEAHGFAPSRVLARGWFREVEQDVTRTRAVDARLITPRHDRGN